MIWYTASTVKITNEQINFFFPNWMFVFRFHLLRGWCQITWDFPCDSMTDKKIVCNWVSCMKRKINSKSFYISSGIEEWKYSINTNDHLMYLFILSNIFLCTSNCCGNFHIDPKRWFTQSETACRKSSVRHICASHSNFLFPRTVITVCLFFAFSSNVCARL